MRVAALLPAATDIVIALGAGDQLVAVTHACTLPTGLEDVPRVTRSRVAPGAPGIVDAGVTALSAAGAPLFELDEAHLAARRPDVILTQAVCEVCAVSEADARAVAARLRPAPRLVTLGAETVDGVLADIGTVAGALGIPEEGDELISGLRSRVAAVHRRLKSAAAPRPAVGVLEWTDPPFSAGHWVPDMIRRAGGTELFAGTGDRSRRLSLDELRDRDPGLVVVAPCGCGLTETVRELERLSESDLSKWLRARTTWAIDADRLTSSPGPQVVRGIEVLARILHPQLFGPPSPADARRIA